MSDEKKEEKKVPAGTLIGNPPAKPPAAPASAAEPTHLTLNDVAEGPAPERPITQPPPLEPAMPQASAEAEVKAILERVAAKPATEPPIHHVGSVSLKPKKESLEQRLVRIASRPFSLLVGAVTMIVVLTSFTIWTMWVNKDAIERHLGHKIQVASPAVTHATRLPPAPPPVLICDEQSILTIELDGIRIMGCDWFPPPANASAANALPKHLRCDDTNHPAVTADGSIKFTGCKPQ